MVRCPPLKRRIGLAGNAPRGKFLPLSHGEADVDCPPANWQDHSCASTMFETIEKPYHLRFDFDPQSKTLLMRFEGRLTDKSLVESYAAIRLNVAATGARAGIWDYSSVTQFGAISADLVRHLARQKPVMDARCRRVIAVTSTAGYGLARMFQIVGELSRPLLTVEHTLDEAYQALRVESRQFEPLERTTPDSRTA